MLEGVKHWARALKRDVFALWLAARDARTPWLAKVVAGFVAAYAFSPIDLIPDFIPILGYLDDFLIVPIGIAIAVRLVPTPLMVEFRAQALARAPRPRSFIAAGLIIFVWFVAMAAVGFWIFRRIG